MTHLCLVLFGITLAASTNDEGDHYEGQDCYGGDCFSAVGPGWEAIAAITTVRPKAQLIDSPLGNDHYDGQDCYGGDCLSATRDSAEVSSSTSTVPRLNSTPSTTPEADASDDPTAEDFFEGSFGRPFEPTAR